MQPWYKFFYRRNESSAASSLLGWNVEASNLSAVVCALSYSIQPLNVPVNVNEVNNPAQIITAEPATRATKLLDCRLAISTASLVASLQLLPIRYHPCRTTRLRCASCHCKIVIRPWTPF